MANREPRDAPAPLFSIIIAVFNDWKLLDGCLRSLAAQIGAPSFEVIVVDDGSSESVPEGILNWNQSYSLRCLRQSHQGISSARNLGVCAAAGSVLIFVDADCRVHQNCLAALDATIDCSPQHGHFQLRLTGDCGTLVGRSEQLRLSVLQNYLLQPDGRIRYLNTAGFAIRRDKVSYDGNLFDPAAPRAEDTLLLANLMQRGVLPLFATDAIVQHAIPLSLSGCFQKEIRSANLEISTYDIIASKGIRIRVTHRERLRILLSMWKESGQDSIGRLAWFVLCLRQATRWIASLTFRCLPRRKSDAAKTKT
jgi:glycosyltransferase involved in cell wall biosynthesis